MGNIDMNKKINVLHIVEFVLCVVTAICMADNACIGCGKHVIEMQFIDATTYGMLMIISVLFLGMFFDEIIEQRTDLCYDAMGGVMCVTSGILVLLYTNHNSNYLKNYHFYRLLIASGCFIANGIVFLVEFFLLIFKKEKLLGGGN